MKYWLLKTEPETYSFSQLLADGKTNWNGVRNFQARNNLRLLARGDLALIYHSGKDKSVAGVARVVREQYPDPDPEGGDWVQVDLEPVDPLKHPVTLAKIKATAALRDLPLIKQSRLSVMPITAQHFEQICQMSQKP